MITIEKTVISETEPQVTNVGWFKPSTRELKYFSDGEWLSAGGSGSIPVASADTLGGVKVGNGLSITQDGILNPKTPDNYYIVLEYSNEEVTITYKIGDTVSRTEVWAGSGTIKRYSGEYPTVVAPAVVYIIGFEEELGYTLLNATLPSWIRVDEGEAHLYSSPLQVDVSLDTMRVTLSITVENGLLRVSELTA